MTSLGKLIVSGGTFSTGGFDATFTGLIMNNAASTLNAGTSNLTISGDVAISNTAASPGFTAPGSSKNFYVTGGFNKSGGVYTHNSGTITFNGTATGNQIASTTWNDFYNISITGSGDWMFASNLAVNNLTVQTGKLIFANNAIDTIKATPTFSSGSLQFIGNGEASFLTASAVDFHSLSSITADPGSIIDFPSTSNDQTLTPLAGNSMPIVSHSGSKKLTLASGYALSCNGILQNGTGQFDFNTPASTVTISGDFKVDNGTSSTFANLAGMTITVSGAATLSGTSASTLLDLNPATNWNLKVSGTLTAFYATITNSQLTSGSVDGNAYSCTNGGNNSSTSPKWNWYTGIVWLGTTTSWNTGSNWVGGSKPGTGDVALFGPNDKSCLLDADQTIAGISFVGNYDQTFDFGTGRTLTITGGLIDFSMKNTATITVGTSTLKCGNGTNQAQTILPPSGATQALPAITQDNGNTSGVLTVSSNPLNCGNYTLTSGKLQLNNLSLSNTIKNFSSSSGTSIDFGTSKTKLKITGTTADFSNTTVIMDPSDTLAFNVAGISFTTKTDQTYPVLKQNIGGGTTTLMSNCKAVSLYIPAGTFKLNSSSITDSCGNMSGSGTLALNGGTQKIGGTTVDFSGLTVDYTGGGLLEFKPGTGIAQSFTPKSGATYTTVTENGTGTGTTTVNGNTTITTLNVNAGTMTTSGTLASSGTITVGGGTFNLGGALTGTNVTASSGTFNLGSALTHSLSGTLTGSGATINFGTNKTKLQLSGSTVNVSSSPVTMDAADTIEFTNAGALAFTPNSGAGVWYPVLKQTGASTTTVGANCKATSLVSAGGTFKLGGAGQIDSIGDISGSATIDLNNAKLATTGSVVNCGSLTNLSFSGTTDTLDFSKTSGTQTFTVKNGATYTRVKQSGAGTTNVSGNTTITNLNVTGGTFSTGGTLTSAGTITVGGGTLTLGGSLTGTNIALSSGTINCGSSLTHGVSGSIAGSGGTFNFGTAGKVNVSSTPVNFTSVTLSSVAGDTLDFTGGGTQVFTPSSGQTFPSIKHSGTGALQLSGNDLVTSNFTQVTGSGGLDMGGAGGKNIQTTGDFTVTGGTSTFTATSSLSGRMITVGGYASFNGNTTADYINMNPGSAWTLKVTGTCTATNAHIQNSTCFTGFSQGYATTSVDLGSNVNWHFYSKWIATITSNWSAGASWSTGGAPTAATDAVFDGSASATGNCVLDIASCLAGSVTMSSGYTGDLNFNGNTLTITNGADFSTGGTITQGNGTLVFSGSGSSTFIPLVNSIFPAITYSGSGSVTVTSYPLTAQAFTINGSGTWNWGSAGLTHSVVSIASSGGNSTMNFGTSTVTVTGNANLGGLSNVTYGSNSSLGIYGGVSQTLTPCAGKTHPAIKVGNGSTFVLGGTLSCAALYLSNSILNFSGYNLTTSGDFTVTGGNSGTFVNNTNRTITIGGTGYFNGGHNSGQLNMRVSTPNSWSIQATTALYADYADLENCHATASVNGKASSSCRNFLGNDYWLWNQDLPLVPLWRISGLGSVNNGVAAQGGVFYLTTSSPDNLLCVNSGDGSIKWSYSPPYGSPNNPDFAFYQSAYYVYTTSDNYLLGRTDHGTYSTELFAPLDLGVPGGTCLVSYTNTDTSLFVTLASGTITKCKVTDGTPQTSWTDVTDNISTSAQISAANYTDIFAATTDGRIDRISNDGTTINSYAIPGGVSDTLPLEVIDSVLYITPKSNKLIAVTLRDFNAGTTKWSKTLLGTNCAPMFSSPNVKGGWVAAGNYVEMISEDKQADSVVWSYNAGSTVTGGPLALYHSTGPVYFGTSGNYHAVDNQTGGIYSGNWPFTSSVFGSVSGGGPWIDLDGWTVIFGTTGGNLDAFSLER